MMVFVLGWLLHVVSRNTQVFVLYTCVFLGVALKDVCQNHQMTCSVRMGIPSANLTVCYWKCPFIGDLPIDSMVIFHRFLYVYQRVASSNTSKNAGEGWSRPSPLTFWNHPRQTSSGCGMGWGSASPFGADDLPSNKRWRCKNRWFS